MRILPKDIKHLIKVANGELTPTLGIFGAKIVSTLTGEIYEGDVYTDGGFIAHVDIYEELGCVPKRRAVKEGFEANGAFLLPGLIDSHIHIESTMMTPINFSKISLACGTTTVVTDPHEIANVCGIKGVKYMLEAGIKAASRQYILIPSCIPSVEGLENAGAVFRAKEIKQLLSLDGVLGLGEIMDFVGVTSCEERMISVLLEGLKKGVFLQGHAPQLGSNMLSAYASSGIKSCHESEDGKEALAKLRRGMIVDARQSSISRNVASIIAGVKHCKNLSHLTLCTDDKDVGEILEKGHMNDVVKEAIKAGASEVDAITYASLNAAKEIGIENLGAIAPGFVADMLLANSLSDLAPSHVFYEGKLVAKDGVIFDKNEDYSFDIEKENTINLPPLSLESFTLKPPVNEGLVDVNTIFYPHAQKSFTKLKQSKIKVNNKRLILGPNQAFVAIINRHAKGSCALGVVEGFTLDKGALASSVSHDCHNVSVVYHDEKDALQAVNELSRIGGGMVYANEGLIKGVLRLEVAGLMSTKEPKALAKDALKMKGILREAGVLMDNPLLRIATLALIVIPEVKMSDKGLIDVRNKRIIPVFG